MGVEADSFHEKTNDTWLAHPLDGNNYLGGDTYFGMAGSSTGVITASGNVGIGTVNPGARLDVSGVAYFGNGSATGNLTVVRTPNAVSTYGGYSIQSAAAGSSYWYYDRQGAWAGKTYFGNNANTGSNSPTTAIAIDGTSGVNRVGI